MTSQAKLEEKKKMRKTSVLFSIGCIEHRCSDFFFYPKEISEMHQGIKPKVEESSKHEDPSLLSLQILKKNERAKLLANYESTRITK